MEIQRFLVGVNLEEGKLGRILERAMQDVLLTARFAADLGDHLAKRLFQFLLASRLGFHSCNDNNCHYASSFWLSCAGLNDRRQRRICARSIRCLALLQAAGDCYRHQIRSGGSRGKRRVRAMLGFDLTEEQKELKGLARKFAEQEII